MELEAVYVVRSMPHLRRDIFGVLFLVFTTRDSSIYSVLDGILISTQLPPHIPQGTSCADSRCQHRKKISPTLRRLPTLTASASTLSGFAVTRLHLTHYRALVWVDSPLRLLGSSSRKMPSGDPTPRNPHSQYTVSIRCSLSPYPSYSPAARFGVAAYGESPQRS